MEFNLINVGIADLAVARQNDILRTILGSCVGICLYDSESKTGGLAHIMLPVRKTETSSAKKYADSALPLLLDEMAKIGSDNTRISAKVVGGATMFNLSEKSMMSEIGRNNIKKVREILKEREIPIVAEDIGGDYGRTIDFYLDTGEIKIKSLSKDEIVI